VFQSHPFPDKVFGAPRQRQSDRNPQSSAVLKNSELDNKS
jgi:hypothetical protein